jgi:hypothetical protein
MRVIRRGLSLLMAVQATTVVGVAQSTSGTISGRVVDGQGRTAPGVSITAVSSALPGTQSAVTSENGDFIVTQLPPGLYTVSFELEGFAIERRSVNLAPTQLVRVDVELGPAAISTSINVTAPSVNVMTQTAQVASNYQQDLIALLPATRDITTALLLAPAIHPTGPAGNFSISGSMTFESLYMVNGVTVTENIRGQVQQNLMIEDAIQETTIATAGIPSEFGRFGGGVVNVVTKSGGNAFGGSFRDTLNNDNWRASVPRRDGDLFANDTKLDNVVPTYEYTLGGPGLKDKLWFFTAGRVQTQKSARQLVVTNIPYIFTNELRRYEGKATYAANASHRVQGGFTKVINRQLNNTNNTALSMDVNSLENRKLPESLLALNYTGVLSRSLFVEGRYSARDFSLVDSGAKSTERINGTLLLDTAGRRHWSPVLCGVCTPEQRDNREFFVKGTYFLSTGRFGSHQLSMGLDSFNDTRFVNNHQSGSDYIIGNAASIVRPAAAAGGAPIIYPQFLANTIIRWRPILVESQGNNFRTHSLFFNDSWAMSSRLSASLGLRWDKNDGVDGTGLLVAKDSTFSPRIGFVVDPSGNQTWSVTASLSKYVAGALNSIADAASAGGNPDLYDFVYAGPPINANPNGPLLTTDVALGRLFDWFDNAGGTSRPISGTPMIRGVSAQVGSGFKSPNVMEYGAGINRQFGSRGALRADFVYRNFSDFYSQRTDLSTGKVIDSRPVAPPQVAGRSYDLSLIENTNVYDRQYAGLTSQATYRFSSFVDTGVTYTLSRAWGNVDGENVGSGPLINDLLAYPEYKQAAWYAPSGDLSIDQRHRARAWVNVTIPGMSGLTLSILQALESGVPYGAVATANGVDAARWITNPGYLTPPSAAQLGYYYTARDAFRTEGQRRTDLGLNYTRPIPGARGLEVFGQLQVVNLFNQLQLCGCGASVFLNGGGVNVAQTVDLVVRNSVTNSAIYQPFNPFTTSPVEDVNWAKGPNFGHAATRFAYTSPRTLRLSFGVRF